MANFAEFLKPKVCGQKVLPDILSDFQTLCFDAVSRNNGVPPPPPTDLRVIATSRSSVSLTWPPSRVDGGSPVTFYRLHYHRQFGDWDRLDVASNMSSYSLLGLRCGTIYQFFMEAINEFGVGERTETVTSATQGTPPIGNIQYLFTFLTVLSARWRFEKGIIISAAVC